MGITIIGNREDSKGEKNDEEKGEDEKQCEDESWRRWFPLRKAWRVFWLHHCGSKGMNFEDGSGKWIQISIDYEGNWNGLESKFELDCV